MQHPTLVHAVARERQLDRARAYEPGLARVLDDSRRPASSIRGSDTRRQAPWPVQPPPEVAGG
jgi:hypothetical protein